MSIPFTVGRLTAAELQEAVGHAAYKTADESRASTTTLANDTELQVAVSANGVYFVDLDAAHDYAAAADMKVSWSGPAGATMVNWGLWWRTGDAVNFAGTLAALGTVVALTSTAATTNQPLIARGVLVIAGTAGTFALQWAQNTSNAGLTTVKAGSRLRLNRVA